MTVKRGQASEEPTQNYDHTKFVNEGAAENFGLISKNRSFIKEKGFHHPEFYNLELVDNGAFYNLYTALNYPEVIRVLTNGQGEWKINSEGMRCISMPNIWPTSPRYGITSSHRVSFRKRMCVK